MTATSNSKPKQTWTAIYQRALKAQQLAVTYAVPLGERLSLAFRTALAADITALSNEVPAAITSRSGAVQSTAAQNAALDAGRSLVSGVHMAVRGHTSDKEVLLGYGVGSNASLSVKHVRAALQTIVVRATAEPAEAASFGIVADDITACNASLTAIAQADAAQEAARAAAPLSTQARNATANRLLASVALISGAGMRVFSSDPTTFALFKAL